MARIFFMAFEAAGQLTLVKKLRSLGHKVALTEPRYPAFYELLKQQSPPPDVFVCDSSRLPSHARESLNYVRSLRSFRETPIILYNLKNEDDEKAKEKVPGAVLLRDDNVLPALERLLARPPPSTASQRPSTNV